MATNISADEVRARLVTLTSVDVSDTILASAPFIPVGDAWLNSKLGYSYPGTLTDNEKVLAKAAEIAFVCHKVITSAPSRGAVYGTVKIEQIKSEDKKVIAEMLEKEWKYYLGELGLTESNGSFYVTSVGGDDYDETMDEIAH